VEQPDRRIVVVGASAGGLEPLMTIVRQLPADFPASMFVVLHLMAGAVSALPTILNRSGPLRAIHPEDHTPIETGMIYVAPPDYHLVVEGHEVRVLSGPRENGFRPAVDALFRSAATTFRHQVAGVILSGSLDDGTAGLRQIKRFGGATIVQDPEEALFRGMPQSALAHVTIDHRLPADRIAAVLVDFARGPMERSVPETAGNAIEPGMPIPSGDEVKARATPSVFSCPECGGVLFESSTRDVMHFRCHVGHAYSSESLLNGQEDALESALWTALRVLEDQIELTERLVARLRRTGSTNVASRFDRRRQEAEHKVGVLRRVLLARRNDPELALDSGSGNGNETKAEHPTDAV
jgi:two-component system, chemotaxis family, protein-glutamate methylesterase/glutaminase